eukprot:845706-Rhodomonas_salina.2
MVIISCWCVRGGGTKQPPAQPADEKEGNDDLVTVLSSFDLYQGVAAWYKTTVPVLLLAPQCCRLPTI